VAGAGGKNSSVRESCSSRAGLEKERERFGIVSSL
jgi:hypothetical protein